MSAAVGPKRVVPVFAGKAQVHPGLSILLEFQLFLSFLSLSEALHSSTLCPQYQRQHTGRRPPPSTPHTTTPRHAPREQHTYLPAHLRRDTYAQHTDTNLHHGHRLQCVCCIRNRGGLDLSYDAGASCGRREAGRYVCVAGVALLRCCVGCGG